MADSFLFQIADSTVIGAVFRVMSCVSVPLDSVSVSGHWWHCL